MISLWIGILLLLLLAVAGVTIFILAALCGRLQRQIVEREDRRDEDHVPAAGKQHSHGGRR